MSHLVSIVMPSLNQAKFIGRAIDSVLAQDYPNIELIVADGGSDDGTVEVLKARQAADARLRWSSQPDSGPAAAVNAALAQVRGTVVGWLNSDDVYASGALRRAVEALESNPNWLMVYGHGQHVDGEGKVFDDYPTLPPSTPIAKFAEGCFICQPTVFFRRSAWVLLGKLDEHLKTAFEFDYWLRAFHAFPQRIGFVDALQAQSRLHAGSITLRMRRAVILEGMQVLARHLGSAPKAWFLTYENELLALPAGERGVGDLKAHLFETLAVAGVWLKREDLRELELNLEGLLQ